MTCLGTGEEGKASGIPCRAHQHPYAGPALAFGFCRLDCLSLA